MARRPQIVVFADIDDVLSHADAYSCVEAAKVLQRLRPEGVPLVLCSGKTRAEIEEIQHGLGIKHPFVCERGGAAFIPAGYFGFAVPGTRDVACYHALEFGRPYTEIVQTLRRAAERSRVEIVGFDDMSVEEVARDCEVSLLQARLAKLREYSERFRVLHSNEIARNRLFRALRTARVRCITGDRYHHAGALVNGNAGAELLRALYRRACRAVFTVGLADGTAEAHALRSANCFVAVSNDTQPRSAGDVVGWAEAVVDLVQDLRFRETTRVVTAPEHHL